LLNNTPKEALMSNQSIHEAAQVLTEMALRPDLSSTLTDEELRIRADYDRMRALEQRRQTLRFELESCRVLLDKVERGLTDRVRIARFSLRHQATLALPTGRAA
jgi:nitrogen-specific signal transduction histidine kinase